MGLFVSSYAFTAFIHVFLFSRHFSLDIAPFIIITPSLFLFPLFLISCIPFWQPSVSGFPGSSHSRSVCRHALRQEQSYAFRTPSSSACASFPLRHSLSSFTTECSFRHALHFLEQRSHGTSFTAPLFQFCCQGDNVKLALPSDPPEPLLSLFSKAESPCVSTEFVTKRLFIVSTSFLENIPAYNNAFSFSFLGVKLDRSVMTSPGPYVFRILGQLYHLMGSLLPSPGDTPKFSQIYSHGPDEAQIDHKMSLFSDGCLEANVVAALQAMMRRFNPYYQIWKIAHTRIMEGKNVLSR